MTRSLLIYAQDRAAVDMASIKSAKQALALDYKVLPEFVDEGTLPRELAAGRSGRMLAIGHKPPWLMADYALISERTGEAGLQAALSWVLGDHDHPRATTTSQTLLALMPGAKEISPEQLASERALRVYYGQEPEEEQNDRTVAFR